MTREELAFFFRPESDEATARSYVRKLLNSAKRMPWAQGLEIESERLRWQVDCDVAQFQDAIDDGRWHEAIELYNGDFLKGLNDVGLPSYDAWLDTERESLLSKWHNAVLNYANDLEAAGQHFEAAKAAQQAFAQDNFAEDAFRVYIKNLYMGGRREQALKAADAFCRVLRAEMDIDPDPETQNLIASIRNLTPLQKAASLRKYGRRSSDKPPEGEAQNMPWLELLKDPSVHVDLVREKGKGKRTMIVTRHIDDTLNTHATLLDLAEGLVGSGDYQRAIELLNLIEQSHHDGPTQKRYEALWDVLKLRLPEEDIKFYQKAVV
ncbi:MAG: bacterial transcriptional activator domain-containing protein [Deinococcota bacterium]